MSSAWSRSGPIILVFLLGLGQAGCNPKSNGRDEAGPAPVDTSAQPAATDTMAAPGRIDSARTGPDTSAATPPITPAQPQRDTTPSGAARPTLSQGEAAKVSQLEYEGWRQYSANCARCHGQDLLPNPVAANLLISLAPGGPIDSEEKFTQVVSAGRPERGMPAFKSQLTPDQIKAIYAYSKARAEKRIPPGRPAQPG